MKIQMCSLEKAVQELFQIGKLNTGIKDKETE